MLVRRKPLLVLRFVGAFLLRFAERLRLDFFSIVLRVLEVASIRG
jgi:hypothetical protein